MACRVQDKTIDDVLELLVAEGFEGMANAMSIMFNEAMRLDRTDIWARGPGNVLRHVRATPMATSQSRLKAA